MPECVPRAARDAPFQRPMLNRSSRTSPLLLVSCKPPSIWGFAVVTVGSASFTPPEEKTSNWPFG